MSEKIPTSVTASPKVLSEDVDACVNVIRDLDLLKEAVYAQVAAQFTVHTILRAATKITGEPQTPDQSKRGHAGEALRPKK